MPSIQDVTQALSQRPGVAGAIVLGKDGLTIDAASSNGLDSEGVSALLPSVVLSSNRVGSALGRGELGTAVLDFSGGRILLTEITSEALLAVIVDPDTNIGGLLYELQRFKPAIAELL